jgi:mRNA-degrading endonuclease RelE of RelBE toxin-antitoxin system
MGPEVKVLLEGQVVNFVAALPPETRRKIRDALRKLEHEKGDIKALQDELTGFCRLRVGSYRILFHHVASARGPHIRCVFMEERSLVYQVAAALLAQQGHL